MKAKKAMPNPNPNLLVLLRLQQERGMDLSTTSWREAIMHAEGLVEIAERKLVRERNAHGRRLAKNEVL